MRVPAPLFSVSLCLRGVLLLFCLCGVISAQASKPHENEKWDKPLDGKPWELGVWAGGGFSVPGGTRDTHVFNAAARMGKVLTGDHGSSFLRGNFEWSADLMPVYYIWQPAPAQDAYGAAFNPV